MLLQPDDSQLLALISAGNRTAFTRMYRQYTGILYNYLYLFTKSKETTEEIIQQTFITVWENRNKLQEIRSLKSYLFTIAKNLLINHINKTRRDEKREAIVISRSETAATDTENHLMHKLALATTQAAIDKLPEKRREIVRLSVMDGLSLDEITQQLGISKNVVKKQLYAGLCFIREELLEYANPKTILLLVTLLLK